VFSACPKEERAALCVEREGEEMRQCVKNSEDEGCQFWKKNFFNQSRSAPGKSVPIGDFVKALYEWIGIKDDVDEILKTFKKVDNYTDLLLEDEEEKTSKRYRERSLSCHTR